MSRYDELKPCPFCGGEAEYISKVLVIPILDKNGAYIDADDAYYEETRCKECGIGYMLADDEDDGLTIEKWNRRADDEDNH